MTYSFWHCGKLLGHADLSHNPSRAEHRAGLLIPTAYGLTLLPRLTRFFTVSLAVKQLLDSRNRSIDDLNHRQFADIIAGTNVERDMRDMGSLLIDMEVRGPDDSPCAVSMLAFTETDEIRRLGAKIGSNVEEQLSIVPPGEKHYVVSLVFRSGRGFTSREARGVH